MKSLISLQFDKALAYPVIDPSINLLFSALLVWEKIELIWGEDDRQVTKFREYASYSPIFFDYGFVTLKEPKSDEIDKASMQLRILRPDYEQEIHNDDGFSNRFIINPVKVTHVYWENARKQKDDFIDVPSNIGRLYLGLLAIEMSRRPTGAVPTLTTRLEEPLFLEGGIKKPPIEYTDEECIAKAGFQCLTLDKNLDSLSSNEIQSLCNDIIELRKLDSWNSWREELYSYKQRLQGSNSIEEVKAITNDLNEKVVKFQRETNRQKLAIMGIITIAVVGSVIGFFVGSVGGAILGASIGATSIGIDFYQSHHKRKERKQTAQQFVIDAQKILSKQKEYAKNTS